MNKVIEVQKENGYAIVTINKPPVNALGEQVASELLDAFTLIENDGEVRSVILTGAGDKFFMAGADIKEFPSWLGNPEMINQVKFNHQLFNKIEKLRKPTIALLNGLTLGGGCELALSCDFRIAEKHSKIGFPEIDLGIFPGGGGTQRLPKLVGKSKAKELMFFGESISAEEALSIGLVNKVVDSGAGLEVAKQWATKLASKSSNAINLIKNTIDYGYEHTFTEGIEYETELFCNVFQHQDAFEGIHAFIEKRKPVFNQSIK